MTSFGAFMNLVRSAADVCAQSESLFQYSPGVDAMDGDEPALIVAGPARITTAAGTMHVAQSTP